MDLQSVQDSLADLPIPAIQYFDRIGSTQEIALSWVDQGVQEGSLVVADEQTSGHGRFNRRWFTPPASALAFSLILHPTDEESSRTTFFSPLAGMAVGQALLEIGCQDVRLKWPNDVLLGGKKVCGILSQAIWKGSQVAAVILGIGINVATSSLPPENVLQFPATSVEHSSGKPVNRLALLHDVLGKIFQLRRLLVSDDFIPTWEKWLAYRGMEVQIDQIGKETITGTFRGINLDGSLRIIMYTGEQTDISAGDLRLRPMEK